MVALVPPDILARPPSVDDGISEEVEDQLRRFGGCLIQKAGGLLKLPQLTVVSAAAMFQRFYFCKSFAEYDVRALSAAALMLAGKLEEHPRKLVEVIQVCYRLKMREIKEDDGAPVYDGKPTPQLDLTEKEFENEKKLVVHGERRILRELGFEVALLLDHPHRYAMEFIEHLNRPEHLAQKVWNFLNDSLQTSLCCAHQPRDIAGACLLLASQELKLTLPSKPPWWKQFSIDLKEVEQIADELTWLYRKAAPEFVDVCRPKKDYLPPATPFTSPPPTPLLRSPSDDPVEDAAAMQETEAAPPRAPKRGSSSSRSRSPKRSEKKAGASEAPRKSKRRDRRRRQAASGSEASA